MRFVLAIKSKSEAFASVCARFGISRKSGYKWWQRYRAGGVKALADRSRRPHPRGKKQRLVWRHRLDKVRRAHPSWGAKKLRRRLQKAFSWNAAHPGGEHVGALAGGVGFGEEAPAKGAARTGLDGEGSTRAQSLQRSVDNRLQGLVSHRRWKAMRTADGARSVQSLCIGGGAPAQSKRCGSAPCDGANFSSLWPAQNHSGGQWRALWWQGALGLSRLSVWWLRLGIVVEFVRPAHPEDNGAHEQMHRVLRADVAKPPAPSVAAQKRRLRAWIRCYNQVRPHEALGQRVPAKIYWPSNRLMPVQLSPVEYTCGWQSRRVRNRGHIKWHGRERFIGRAFVGQLVGLKTVADGVHEVYFQQQLIGLLYARDLSGMRPAAIARHP
jgi:putative transposase